VRDGWEESQNDKGKIWMERTKLDPNQRSRKEKCIRNRGRELARMGMRDDNFGTEKRERTFKKVSQVIKEQESVCVLDHPAKGKSRRVKSETKKRRDITKRERTFGTHRGPGATQILTRTP